MNNAIIKLIKLLDKAGTHEDEIHSLLRNVYAEGYSEGFSEGFNYSGELYPLKQNRIVIAEKLFDKEYHRIKREDQFLQILNNHLLQYNIHFAGRDPFGVPHLESVLKELAHSMNYTSIIKMKNDLWDNYSHESL